MQTGIYPGLDESVYRSDPAVSQSDIKTLLAKSPAHLRFGERNETDSMRLGTLIHTAVLEPNLLAQRYFVGPDEIKSSQPWKRAAKVALNLGKQIVHPNEYNISTAIAEKIRADKILKRIFSASPTVEGSAFWEEEVELDDGETVIIPCKCRCDIVIPGMIIDLKSTRDASGNGPQYSVEKYRYDIQAWSYMHGWMKASGQDIGAFLFVFVEPAAPYAFKVVELSQAYMTSGEQDYREGLRQYAHATTRNYWPAYDTAIQTLEPSYRFAKEHL